MANKMVTCTGAAFKSLTDAYTGAPMVVKMLVTKSGEAKFFSPSTYSASTRYATKAAAYASWARSEGIADVRKGQPIVCAYTGEPLVLRHDETGWYFEGGFDPRRFYTRAEFLYYATMRGGKSAYKKPGTESSVGVVTEKKTIKKRETPMLDGSMERAAAAMEASGVAFEKKTVVSMSTPKRRTRG